VFSAEALAHLRPPQDGFAVANLGIAPGIVVRSKLQKNHESSFDFLKQLAISIRI
jgi:hypothetical protein